jgi:hypothetical protein
VKVLAGVFWCPVTDGNCVAARRGGEQPEVNDQSVTQVNSIRPAVVASLLDNGEAQVTHGPVRAATTLWSGKPDARNPRKASGRRKVAGDGTIGRFDDKTQGDLGDAKAGDDAPTGADEPVAQESEHP